MRIVTFAVKLMERLIVVLPLSCGGSGELTISISSVILQTLVFRVILVVVIVALICCCVIICYCVRHSNKHVNVGGQSGVLPHSNHYYTTTHIQQAPPVQTFQLSTRSEPFNQSSNSDYNKSDNPPVYSVDSNYNKSDNPPAYSENLQQLPSS